MTFRRLLSGPACPASFGGLPLRRLAAATLLALLLTTSGCAVGPDYRRPALPPSIGFAPQPLPATTAAMPGAPARPGAPATPGTPATPARTAEDSSEQHASESHGSNQQPSEQPVSNQHPSSQHPSDQHPSDRHASEPPVSPQHFAEQRFTPQADIAADWWTLFRSPALDALVKQAFAANPGIDSAQAALRLAQENARAQQGAFFPSVSASYSPSRTDTAGGSDPTPPLPGSLAAPVGGPVIYNLHTAQLNVGFLPDVFGGNRRLVEAAQAQVGLERFQLRAAFVTLASNLVVAAVQDASLRRQIAVAEESVEADRTALALVQRQLAAGYASRLELANQQSALAQAGAVLPGLRKQFEQNRDQLRALAGLPQDREVPAFDLDGLHLPETLPETLPSRLIEQRPDVRAAEAQVQAASAQVGVARAARLPQFAISATAGGTASRFGDMFSTGGRFFDLALAITQPIFDGGTLLHRERAADAGLAQAAAQYRSTVLTAFQNVADSLHAIHTDADALRSAADAAEAARTTMELSRRLQARGYLDRLAQIAAETGYRQAQTSLVQAEASRLIDSAALFQALGGGWWHEEDE